MRKIAVLVMLAVLSLVLVACGSKPYAVEGYVSVNKLEYQNIGEINSGVAVSEDLDKKNDIEFYVLMSNGTISKVKPSFTNKNSAVTTGLVSLTVSAENMSKDIEIYVKPEGQAEKPALTALSLTSKETKVEQEASVRLLVAPLITNNPNTSDLTVLVLDGQNVSGEDIAVNLDNHNAFMKGIGGGKVGKNGGITLTSAKNGVSFNIDLVTYTHVYANNNPIHPKTASWHWDWILIIPIAFILQLFSFGNSFAWGILFATIIIRTIAWPIYAKTNDMSIKTALAQPELQRVQAKYATRKDPASQQKMQMETMKIYKKHGIGILGCLTPILQMPLFIAMYQVVSRIPVQSGMYADKVSHQTMLWGLVDLTKGSQPISFALAAVVGGTMLLLNILSSRRPSYAKQTGTQNKTAQAAQTEKTMKMVNYIMVIFMAVAAYANNALAFYWIIGNLYSIGQSLINRKLSERKYNKRKNENMIS